MWFISTALDLLHKLRLSMAVALAGTGMLIGLSDCAGCMCWAGCGAGCGGGSIWSLALVAAGEGRSAANAGDTLGDKIGVGACRPHDPARYIHKTYLEECLLQCSGVTSLI